MTTDCHDEGGALSVPLRKADAGADPFTLFARWYEAARAACAGTACAKLGLDPSAMMVATATPDGRPSARVVLLKQFDERGFVFHTDRQSGKARDLRTNARAALVLHWPPLGRQVRIMGDVEELDDEAARDYFASRPRGSQIAAHASHQGRVIPDRAWLDERFAELEEQFSGQDVPMPASWVGYRVVPVEIEFWQARPNRLHDRLRYQRTLSGTWRLDRLAP
jgi:pyridoxamine 5'-phosphate oxidase